MRHDACRLAGGSSLSPDALRSDAGTPGWYPCGMDHSTSIDTLGHGKYLSLTTFRADGTPVATPVWLIRDGDVLRVLTQENSGKVKRLRVNATVLVASCDMRGRIKGAQVPASATLQAVDETARTSTLIRKRYGLMGRMMTWMNERGSRKAGPVVGAGHVGITIRLAP
ncbi:unannotated protein [freshwater metagenome]|uniref:Unannotated protein n=1 Tax=freshwater metagenome TaxID=449393 RepID=A0A6J7DKG6_9ZZZZ